MTKDEALKLALEKFEFMNHVDSIFEGEFNFQINAIKEALAQPEQKPVAWAMYQKGRLLSFWMDKGDAYNFEFTSEHSWSPLYTTPPQRKPLTDEEIGAILEDINAFGTRLYTFARAIEAAHGIKGEA